MVKSHDRMVSEFKEGYCSLRAAVRDAEWITPLTLDRPLEELPTLDELFNEAWQVGCDGSVTQYIRAQPVASGPVLKLKVKILNRPITKSTKLVNGVRLRGPILQLASTATTSGVPNYARVRRPDRRTKTPRRSGRD